MSLYQQLDSLGYTESLYVIECYDEYVARQIANNEPVMRLAEFIDSDEWDFGDDYAAWLDKD